MVKNRKCLSCGTKYSYCPDCSRADALKPSWYNDFCVESCKDLWLTASRYSMGRITKSDAKSVILELDLKPLESYSQFIQKEYSKIMAEEKKPKRGKRAETPIIDEVAEIKIEQPVVAELVAEEPIHVVVLEEKE